MHLSETRGPNERRASLQSCSVLGGEIFCVTQNDVLDSDESCIYAMPVCFSHWSVGKDSS